MNIMRVRAVKISNCKSVLSLLLTSFVLAAPKLGGVETFYSEDRRTFSDLSQIPTTLEHGFYVIARRTPVAYYSLASWSLARQPMA
jgi:hypothetical protein